MVNLTAQSPADGLTPITHGALRLEEAFPGQITCLLPFEGQTPALSHALTKAFGLTFPEPGQLTTGAGAQCVWSGRGQAFLIGPAPVEGLEACAALTDQSDAWVALDLLGEAADEVLARLVPLDLRPAVFRENHSARSQLQHANVLFHRVPDGFRIYGFRSMAATLVHETADAMAAVAARREAY